MNFILIGCRYIIFLVMGLFDWTHYPKKHLYCGPPHQLETILEAGIGVLDGSVEWGIRVSDGSLELQTHSQAALWEEALGFGWRSPRTIRRGEAINKAAWREKISVLYNLARHYWRPEPVIERMSNRIRCMVFSWIWFRVLGSLYLSSPPWYTHHCLSFFFRSHNRYTENMEYLYMQNWIRIEVVNRQQNAYGGRPALLLLLLKLSDKFALLRTDCYIINTGVLCLRQAKWQSRIWLNPWRWLRPVLSSAASEWCLVWMCMHAYFLVWMCIHLNVSNWRTAQLQRKN